jgi:hypothetical protein
MAQFGTIFGDPAPRPPGSVPGGRQQIPTATPQQQEPGGTGTWNTIQPNTLPQQGQRPPVGQQPAGQAPGTGTPTAQRPIRVPTQPTDTSVQPGDEVIAEPPAQKIVNPTAVFHGLDKITGRILPFDVAIGETVQFGALQVTPRACYTRPITEKSNTDAFVEVDEVTLQGEVRRIFTGWIFAASPGLHAVEHAIYDIWLTECKGGAQTVAAEQPAANTPAATTPPARTPPRNTAPKQQRPVQQQQQAPQGFPQFR